MRLTTYSDIKKELYTVKPPIVNRVFTKNGLAKSNINIFEKFFQINKI